MFQKVSSHDSNTKLNALEMDSEKVARHLAVPSSMSTGSGRAGLVSGLGSISPGFNFLGSSPTSSSLSRCAALSLKSHTDANVWGRGEARRAGRRRRASVQQIFVMLQTLGGRAAYDGRDGSPLGGHQLGQMKKLLLLLSGPLRFLNAGVQPFVPEEKPETL